jgi:hypothetical protein
VGRSSAKKKQKKKGVSIQGSWSEFSELGRQVFIHGWELRVKYSIYDYIGAKSNIPLPGNGI